MAYHVLFVCTHNSARSVMAEALLNALGHDQFVGHSAGSQPSGTVNPYALKALERMRVSTDGLRSKDWAQFAGPGAPEMDFVFTVCANAADEVCPVWPGQPMTAHWGLADPTAVQGTEEQKAQVFWDTALALKRRIELMLALPWTSLSRLAIQRELKDIGTR